MGQPAARVGDPTSHGGVIMPPGCLTVLIGGQPAARLGDMHVCPMLNPGVPPPPHVGMPIMKGSATVLIGGQPAARQGDIATCAGPPDPIMMGFPTVLIGDAAGGGAGGGAGASSGSSGGGGGTAASVGSVVSATIATKSPPGGGGPPSREDHWIKFEFKDKVDDPIGGTLYTFDTPDGKEWNGTLGAAGEIWWSGHTAGQGRVVLYGVTNAKWSQDEAKVGDTLALSADVESYPSGTPAKFLIYKRDVSGTDTLIAVIDAETQGDKVEAQWQYQYDPSLDGQKAEDEEKGYSFPEFYFDILVKYNKARSGLMRFTDWVEVELKFENGDPAANADVTFYLSSGEVRRKTLDSNGKKREENVPPVEHRVRFPSYPDVIKVP